MKDVVLDGLDEALRVTEREVVREEVADLRPAEHTSPWLSVESAAKYLDTTEQAIRALVKRGQLKPHRTPTGRLLFHRGELDAWVLDGAGP